MALNNFANIKAAIKSWSKREDVDDKLDDFIVLAENAMYTNSIEPIRIRSMITTETSAMSTSVRTQALPTDFLDMRRFDVTVSGLRPKIDYVTPAHQVIRDGSGTPSNYTITDQIEYDILPDQAYVTNIVHYAKLTALSASNTTNDILTNHPEVYLYGGLMKLFQWAEDDEQALKYQQLFFSAINAANSVDKMGNTGVATQKARRGRNP